MLLRHVFSAGDIVEFHIQLGRLQKFTDGRFALYRTRCEPLNAVKTSGGRLVFNELTGKAEVWIDGRLAGEKATEAAASFAVDIPPGDGERLVGLLIEASPGAHAGLGGDVTVEAR
jgi:beta-galactosidase